ncbi:hypothetical protein EJ05DRAFT_536318 [Pseudovirgaria hyperparasitica]|uniref:Cytochrome b561 domain-containing protein n=1 Tax=Pseudovirgaria hyperparasitica TaxID=470096 RepID=A0A6A6WDL0_9PEZI|nr:uncharacterized protein EJ05DRAFT_536318 [Pseudovirgaria hyperparasitica]KAF2760144.1 hypothetical protein EJ05DRAFT_536318 [Pseudovirgaria hyperparasitica]
MASATGIPERNPASTGYGEDEPLLGRAGDASQQKDKALPYNLILGTAPIAQLGIWVLTAAVWGSVFSHDFIFFSYHPLLNSVGILLVSQAALILQPTHTPQQKKNGTYAHAAFNDLGVAALVAGLIVIVKNKGDHGHFESPHAILGLITYILLGIQALVGITMYFVPAIYGGVNNAKSIWKYHRMSGYLVFVLLLATVAAATQTYYVKNVLKLQLWAVIVTAVITLAGILPRIKKQKLGL